MKVLVQPFGPKRHPAARAFHERDFQFRETVKYSFADHVHESDHQFEWKGGHVHVTIFFHALAAGAHHAPYAVLTVVLRLRVDGERHTDFLRGSINRIEHAVA